MKKALKTQCFQGLRDGDEGSRTPDLLNAIQARCRGGWKRSPKRPRSPVTYESIIFIFKLVSFYNVNYIDANLSHEWHPCNRMNGILGEQVETSCRPHKWHPKAYHIPVSVKPLIILTWSQLSKYKSYVYSFLLFQSFRRWPFHVAIRAIDHRLFQLS